MKQLLDIAWAKAEKIEGEICPPAKTHHLVHHSADVAACFLELTAQAVWRDRLERAAEKTLSARQIEQLACLVFLHDVGKLSPGFQCKIWSDEEIETLGADSARCRGAIGHPQAGAELLLAARPRDRVIAIQNVLHLSEIGRWADNEILTDLLLASFAHHGRPLNAQTPINNRDVEDRWKPLGKYDPLFQAEIFGALMREWFQDAFRDGAEGHELPGSAAFQHLFAGLVMLADWIGSDREFFPFAPEPYEDYFLKAKKQAQRAIKAFGINVSAQRLDLKAPVSFKSLTTYALPNPQQALMGEISTDAQLVILEAETGSGKTEAALWRFIKLYEAGAVDGLYFAVPTRTAAVQLHKRVHRAARRVFGDAAPETVLAVPGYFVAGEHQGRALPNWKVLWDDADGKDRNEIIAKRWAAENPKRYLAAQIAVGTIDQAMLGALPAKHAHLRASSLARSLLVIDEVHASDIYMTRIQQKLVDDHIDLGGHVMAMSATLGSTVRSKWMDMEAPDFEVAKATAYPAIWVKGDPDPTVPDKEEEKEAEEKSKNKDVAVILHPTMETMSVALEAVQAARAGAKILVVRNTVDAAVKTFAAVDKLLGEHEQGLLFQVQGQPTLHHGRFAAEDRRLLDGEIENMLGKNGCRPELGLIVIGTQTLEQSLDICADYLITDLCPVDVLLQRIGRLHRHAKNARPEGYQQPQCLVLAPEEGLEACLCKMINGLGGWTGRDGCLSGIYLDVAGLELTKRQIEAHPIWHIPAMNRELVESATHRDRINELVEELGPDWSAYYQKHIGGLMAEAMSADLQAMDRSKNFVELAFPDDEWARTRIGEDGHQLTFDPPVSGPFGEKVSKMVIPAHWSRHIAYDAEPDVKMREDGTLEISIGGKVFFYNAMGLIVDKA